MAGFFVFRIIAFQLPSFEMNILMADEVNVQK
jgi:hypothetical protein